MADPFLTARHKYIQNIKRLSTTVPGYSQLAHEIKGGAVRIARTDFGEQGNVRRDAPHDPDSLLSDPTALYEWLCEGGLKGKKDKTTTTRYVLVEDLDTEVCYTLGAALGIEPQFWLDHMNGHVFLDKKVSRELDRRIRWNTWNLNKRYSSFRWYRPVCRKFVGAAYRRKQVEARYENMTEYTAELTRRGMTHDHYDLEVVRSASNILRPEWDLSGYEMAGEADLVAIEEWVSIYETVVNGCQYVIMLLDPIPKESRAKWTQTPNIPLKPYIPPDSAHFEVTELYQALVPRFNAVITTATIPDLSRRDLKEIYETMHSTMTCIWNSSGAASQSATSPFDPSKHLPFIHLFHIIKSDTLGLLHLMEDVPSEIMQSTASQDAQIDEILSRRTFIADLHAHLPPLREELKKAMRALLSRGNGDSSHHDNINELDKSFERTIQDLKEASNAITGTLQFIESHRAILEAESVTRLTELAFLFIPLSFAASLFSMQIQELTNPVPVWHFVLFAVLLSTSTYALRLVARSTWVHRQKQNILDSIRARSAVRRGAPVRNTAIFAWTLARLGPSLLMIFVIACFLVPLMAVIWTRNLDLGFKIGLSLLFFVFIFSVTAMFILAAPGFRRRLQSGMQIKWYRIVEEGKGSDRE